MGIENVFNICRPVSVIWIIIGSRNGTKPLT